MGWDVGHCCTEWQLNGYPCEPRHSDGGPFETHLEIIVFNPFKEMSKYWSKRLTFL